MSIAQMGRAEGGSLEESAMQWHNLLFILRPTLGPTCVNTFSFFSPVYLENSAATARASRGGVKFSCILESELECHASLSLLPPPVTRSDKNVVK